ncbi:MAG: LysR family glycine cleavage system transcriptional activator [Planctomycetota bacterium]|jgi:LysR family glycine cleavage system transcriptional activator
MIWLKINMTKKKYHIPSSSALTAFECSARQLNFSRAAEELHTSQSAVSRHITELESSLGVTLFIRGKKQHRLTEQGEYFYRAVVSGLDNIQSAANALTGWSSDNDLTIACTHEISHLYLMPRFEAMREAVGESVKIRIVTNEYEDNTVLDPRIDLSFAYKAAQTASESTSIVFKEAVCPVCSPQFLAQHGDMFDGPVSSWSGLAFLQLTKPNKGWATWDDWFAWSGASASAFEYTRYDNYVYLLEASVTGRGLALGWRGLIERYLEAGTLALVAGEFMQTSNALHAQLTPTGQAKQAALTCLEFLTTDAARTRESKKT